jgi:hypothetical protein
MRSGIEMIAEERRRQVQEEGWTPAHDDAHRGGQLAMAGACYAIPAHHREAEVGVGAVSVRFNLLRFLWPWRYCPPRGPSFEHWWKPTPDDRVRELVKAGALIAAEIDRLQRRAASAPLTEDAP